MPKITLKLQSIPSPDFIQSAMALVQKGDQVIIETAQGITTLLHILVLHNNNGSNNYHIAKLVGIDSNVLEKQDFAGRTPLESLMAALHHCQCTFANFKQSAMFLAKMGADIKKRSIAEGSPTLLHILLLTNPFVINIDEIIELIDLNPESLVCTDGKHFTALQLLIELAEVQLFTFETFKHLAMNFSRKGADITRRSTIFSGRTLLHYLVASNEAGLNNDAISELVTRHPNALASTDGSGCTALQFLMDSLYLCCCTFEDFKTSAMILARRGADITMRSTKGDHPTLLHVLVRKNKNGINDKEIEELVKLNSNALACIDEPDTLFGRDRSGYTALQALMETWTKEECPFESFKQLAMLFIKQGANLSLQKTEILSRDTVLHLLVLSHINENDKEIDELIALNGDLLNIKDGNHRTPVHALLDTNSSIAVAKFEKLLSATNLDLKDYAEATLLHAACHSGNLPAVKHLFGKGLSLTALTKYNETLIHYAVSSGNPALIQWLVDTQQIDINTQDRSGETALHRAAAQNNSELVELLIRNGADSTIENNKGQRASEIATSKGYHHLVPYLFFSQNNKTTCEEEIMMLNNQQVI